ncbi:DUF2231 domain-containing protein [Cellulomonas sp. zg-ZUI222]|uniref:DUF2231 domain-containing protein n=1 Tax=Cellulomonas wangleii TaxID=2816956 RepID=A0ABX8D015_9CELL|nr:MULTISPECIES: DUF2231 domain-containing protein [Cellulomonas]MBO0900284.1 DUF2231 domain-containing protein [Cellulomonas sp. zg-ZUI22]MBO0920802.1 DUF2231 domain-containing protein [Cellulomonas wangleii]MBO0926602.1 DUF2231 domain-containing protein [Cellulomonas wangleii]QVI60838.1 DUF2231 domain-containing protein [Cellulomonas wangleii]
MSDTDDRTSPALRATRALERSDAFDAVIERWQPRVAAALEGRPGLAARLHGRDLGHALHPLMTDLPLGLWMSATTLDLVGGDSARPHAERLLGLGVLAALPTSLTGLADWAVSGRRTQRVGAAHAALNSVALGLYAGSWVLRRRGAHSAGVAASLLATGVVSAGGYLGGHMSFRLGSPPRRHSGPATTRTVPDADEVDVAPAPGPPSTTPDA